MPDAALSSLETALEEFTDPRYQLILFVSGASASSARAIGSVQGICTSYLLGRHDLRVVDVNQEPELARGRRILATPTLLKVYPEPQRMLVGDLSDAQRVLSALGVPMAPDRAAGRG